MYPPDSPPSITAIVSFLCSFLKEREIDWHDLWHDSKRNTQVLKRKEIGVQSKEKLIGVIDDT
jgi:hypothetical protein